MSFRYDSSKSVIFILSTLPLSRSAKTPVRVAFEQFVHVDETEIYDSIQNWALLKNQSLTFMRAPHEILTERRRASTTLLWKER